MAQTIDALQLWGERRFFALKYAQRNIFEDMELKPDYTESQLLYKPDLTNVYFHHAKILDMEKFLTPKPI